MHIYKIYQEKNNQLSVEYVISKHPPHKSVLYIKEKKFKFCDQDFFILSKHIIELLKIPLSINKAIEILATEKKSSSSIFLKFLYQEIQKGKTMSACLSKFKLSFIIRFFLKTAESTGDYLSAFTNIHEFLSEKILFKEYLKKNLKYPVILFFMVMLTVFILSFSFDFSFVFCVLLLIMSMGFVFTLVKKFFISALVVDYRRIQILYSIGSILKANIPLTQCLKVISSHLFASNQNDLKAILSRIEQGYTFKNACSNTILDTKLLKEILFVAEETGMYPSLILKAADYMKENLKNKIQNALAFLQPILITLLGIIICILIMTTIIPLYDSLFFYE